MASVPEVGPLDELIKLGNWMKISEYPSESAGINRGNVPVVVADSTAMVVDMGTVPVPVVTGWHSETE